MLRVQTLVVFYLTMIKIYLKRSNKSLTNLIRVSNFNKTNFIIGHSRLITNSLSDNQPEGFYICYS